MNKIVKIILLIALVAVPLIFYKSLSKKNITVNGGSNINQNETLPSIALIFDDLGHSLSDLQRIYSLDIPVTISVIPGLKFSKNIAHIGSRCGFSVFIHLPLEAEKTKKSRLFSRMITTDLNKREIRSILRHNLNSIRIAIGVNNHMGSKATKDPRVMKIILKELKRRNLVFVDSRTSPDSLAYDLARKIGLTCGYNQGFLDSVDTLTQMEKRMDDLILKAKEKGKIIIIAHPKNKTLRFLEKNLPKIKEKINFITIKDYFRH